MKLHGLQRAAHHLWRYSMAASGPLATAAAQFLLALVLISRLEPAEFGRFSFLMVLSQFGLGLWSALFSAPLMVAISRDEKGQGDAEAIVGTSYLTLAPVALFAACVAAASGASIQAAMVYGLFVTGLLGRQVARTRALAIGMAPCAALSDLAFAFATLGGAGLFFMRAPVGLSSVFLPLLAGTILGLIPVRTLLRPARRAHLPCGESPLAEPRLAGGITRAGVSTGLIWMRYHFGGYRTVWQRDARWSILGVTSTELTVNSHAYALTILAGPAAFAPIAAAGLFIRPVTVFINALNEFERARFAGVLHRGDTTRLWHERSAFFVILLLAWAATLGAALAILVYVPHLLPHAGYDMQDLMTAVLLWFAVALARCLHTPDGALLQAQGKFRMLAGISVWTAALSLLGVLAGLWLMGPVWSLLGIVLGEGAYAIVLLTRGAKSTRQIVSNSAAQRS